MKDINKKNKIFALVISIFIPIMIYLFNLSLSVQKIDVMNKLIKIDSNDATYSIILKKPDDEKSYALFFEAHGNIIEIFNNDKKIYEYGEKLVDENKMVGDVYVNIKIEDDMYNKPIYIKMTPIDKNANDEITKMSLCLTADTIHYYITNGNMTMLLSLFLICISILSIPIFILLYKNLLVIKCGLCFAGTIFSLGVFLFAKGGHYLVLFDNQYLWTQIRYVFQYMLPVWLLLYLKELETKKNNDLQSY